MKSGILIRGYLPTVKDMHLEKEFIKKPVAYETEVPKVIATNRISSSSDKMNSFVLTSISGER